MSAVPKLGSSLTNPSSDERRRVVCATDDFDVYRDTINGVYYPARLELVDPSARLSDAAMIAYRLTDLTIGIVHFGAEVSIDPGDMGGYHIGHAPRGVGRNKLWHPRTGCYATGLRRGVQPRRAHLRQVLG